MNETSVSPFFISEKIAKIRWVPEQLKESERFLTGSWDMPKNYLRIWRLRQTQYADDYADATPKCSDKISFEHDITGLEFIDEDKVAVSCADGHITLVRVKRAMEEDTLEELARSPLLHKVMVGDKALGPAPCTGISVYNKDIASVGEDGRLNIYNIATPHQVFRTIDADSCSLTTVAYVSPQEVLTGNRMGIIRMFDIRAAAESTHAGAFELPSEDDKRPNFVSCLTSHPSQPHIVLAGSEEGSITVWDLRQPGEPASYLSAHKSPISEIGFHRTQPTRLFTAAESGDLWMWSQQPTVSALNTREAQASEGANPWLSGERTKNRINITSLVSDLGQPINTFDAHGSKIICGSDSEAVYLIENIF